MLLSFSSESNRFSGVQIALSVFSRADRYAETAPKTVTHQSVIFLRAVLKPPILSAVFALSMI